MRGRGGDLGRTRQRWRRRRRLGRARLEQIVVVARAQDDAALLDARRVCRDGVDQRTIVRHEQDRALERVEGILERLAALDVEVVRRLVEHEQVRARGDDRRERQAAALAARQHADLALDLALREQEHAQDGAGLRLRQASPRAGSERLDDRQVIGQLARVLREVGRLDAVAELELARVHSARAEQGLDERGLAAAVRADQRDALPALDRERGVLEQRLVAVPEHEAVDLGDDPAAARGLREAERERLLAPWAVDALDPLERLLLALRLA